MFFNKPKFWNNKKLTLIAILLYPLSLIVILINKIKEFKNQLKFSIPVICIGNVYIGGTGKTPISIKIYELLIKIGKKPAFIKKFYPYLLDEINMLENYGRVYCSNNRINSINKLINENNNIAILDDGFQDNTIFKNLSILCFNESQMLGNGLVIPSGPLRETLKSVNRAQIIFFNGKKNLDFEKKILKINSSIKFFYFKYKLLNKELFVEGKYIAFAGIGNPENFFNLLIKNNINLVENISFNDHYKFKKKDIDRLFYLSEKKNAKLITTEKDYHRLEEKYKNKINFIKIKVELEHEESFIKHLKMVI